MSKKPKRAKQYKAQLAQSTRTDVWMSQIEQQMLMADYTSVINTCQRLLSHLPQRSLQRADVLAQLGTAHALLKNFLESYDAFTEALTITPNEADLWFNRGMSSRATSRMGQAARDFERAVELHENGPLARQFAKELRFSQKMAQRSVKLRGPNFTLDQLIEQEECYQQALKAMQANDWEGAEQALRDTIAMGDCLPQPWGNLGLCLVMQQRYDEAEAALKRALEIDRRYMPARINLAALPETRRSGPPSVIGVIDP